MEVKIERGDGTFEHYGECEIVVQDGVMVVKPKVSEGEQG